VPDIAAAAERLTADRLAGRPVTALAADCRPGDAEQAYAIQALLHERLRAGGRGALAGYKLGCTTGTMQRFLGIDRPTYGGMLADGVLASGAALRHGDYEALGIECEIAVRLASDLPTGVADLAAVAEHVESCMAAIELVDNRYGDFLALGVPTLIADDFFHAACVLGPPAADWRDLDLAAVRGRTLVDGAEAGIGVGADVMGHPFNAVAWLARELGGRGQTLCAGQIVLTGSIVATQWLGAEVKTVAAEIDGFGRVDATLT
jgi:2-keto-4-pentenoate hydratase